MERRAGIDPAGNWGVGMMRTAFAKARDAVSTAMLAFVYVIAAAVAVAAPAIASPAAATARTAALPMTGAAANEAIIRSQIAMMNRGDWAGALSFYAADSKNFGRPAPLTLMSRLFGDLFTTFPDFKMAIADVVAQGDWVIVRGRASGTHQGVAKIPLFGGLLVGVAPTNKHFEADVMHWYKMSEGKIVDHYDTRDDLAMMQQLGLSPQPMPFDWAKFAADAQGVPQ